LYLKVGRKLLQKASIIVGITQRFFLTLIPTIIEWKDDPMVDDISQTQCCLQMAITSLFVEIFDFYGIF